MSTRRTSGCWWNTCHSVCRRRAPATAPSRSCAASGREPPYESVANAAQTCAPLLDTLDRGEEERWPPGLGAGATSRLDMAGGDLPGGRVVRPAAPRHRGYDLNLGQLFGRAR